MASKSIAVNGTAVRQVRKLLGVRTDAIAAEMGVSYSYLANIENGHCPSIAPEHFKRLIEVLRLDDPRVIMRAESADEVIARLVAEAPPLSDYQRYQLGLLLGA